MAGYLTEPVVTVITVQIAVYIFISLFIRFGKHAKKYEDERKTHEIGIAFFPIYWHLPLWLCVAVLNVVATVYATLNTGGLLPPHEYTIVMALNWPLLGALAGFQASFWLGRWKISAGASIIAFAMVITMIAFLGKVHFWIPMSLFMPCALYMLYNGIVGLNFGFDVGRMGE